MAMRMIDVRCLSTTCGYTFEYLLRTRDGVDDPLTPPACTACGQPVEIWHPPPRVYGSPDPIIVFRAPDGSFRFPGDAAGAQAARYTSQGFERVELRGAADVRRFEKVMNAHEYSRALRRVEVRQQQRLMREHATRGDLRMRMQSFSRLGREIARAAMARNDAKPIERAAFPNFHAEVYAFDRSNRDESRDARGKRRRD